VEQHEGMGGIEPGREAPCPRRVRWLVGLSLLAAGLSYTSSSDACTAFASSRGEPTVAKSYDWHEGAGMVIVNKRGVDKRALVLGAKDKPLSWRSKLGSVTFNQYGREFPSGGFNEAGLVVEALWLSDSAYPADDRPAVNELQWVQHALDSYPTVLALLEEIDQYRIAKAYGSTHYLACDATGDCAAVEFLRGKAVVAHRSSMPVKSLANSTYAESEENLKTIQGFGGERRVPTGRSSLDRFARASAGAAGLRASDPASFFSVLETVQGDSTQWQLVYQLRSRKVHFKTLASSSAKEIDLDRLDFSCESPPMVLDIDTRKEGDVTGSLEEYSPEDNARLIERTLNPFERHLPRGARDLVASYPDTLSCGAADLPRPRAPSADGGPLPKSPRSCSSGCATAGHDADPWAIAFGLLGCVAIGRRGLRRRDQLQKSSQ